MTDIPLFWLYLLNAVLLITHEIDSAYWQEWRIFRLPGGIGGFLLMHVPLVALVLWGLIQVWEGTPAGSIFSICLAGGGIFAFSAHTIFIKRGHKEFDTAPSIALLWVILIVSLAQLATTIVRLD